MKHIYCWSCYAIVTLAAVGSDSAGQVVDNFGLTPNPGEQPGESPFAEKSVLAGGQLDTAELAHDLCQCVGESESASVAKIEQALRSPLKASGFDFHETPLEEVISFIHEDYGIPVKLDINALEEIGIDAQEPVSVSLHGISLRAALRLTLKQLQLTYIIQDEVLMITTPEEAESQLIVCVYDVGAIVQRVDAQSVKQLIDTIVSCVATETWAANGGGEAEIRPLNPGLLVVSQTRAVHDEVRALLATIRGMRKRTSGKTSETEKSTSAAPDAERVVTRAYHLQLGEAANPEAVRQQVRSLITSSLPDERWQGQLDDGQPVLLTILPDRVVLRHKSSVHSEVEKLLIESGVASSTPANTREMGGRSGYGGGFGRGAYGRAYVEGIGGYGRGGFGESGIGGEEGLQPQPAEND